MRRSFIPLSLLLGFFLMFSVSCNKDETEEPVAAIKSIDARIMRIVDNDNGGVNIFMSVTDQDGQAIKNLNESNFDIFKVENNGALTPVLQNGPSSQPGVILSALTMDYSGSMYTDPLSVPSMENAISTFINLKDPVDQVEIIKFSTNVDVEVPLTSNHNILMGGLSTPYGNSGGSTALYRSIQQGQNDIMNGLVGNPNYLPSIIAFTDGKNNENPLTIDTIIINSSIIQIPVYTVGYGVQPDTVALKAIADSTGGSFFWSPNTTSLASLYQMVNGQLSNSTIVTVTGPTIKGKVKYRVKAKIYTPYGYFEDTDEKYFYY